MNVRIVKKERRMKKNLLLVVTTLFLGIVVNAQTVKIYEDGAPGTLFNGDTVYVTSGDEFVYPHLIVENNSGATLNVLWKRLILTASAPGFTDQLCDNQLCFICTGNPWVRPSALAIADGANTVFQPKLSTGGVSGTAHYRYYVMDAGSTNIDSVDVVFTSTVGIEEKISVNYQAYPNPASSVFNIKLKVSPNTGLYQVKLYNIMGELVATETLVDGLNTVNIANLTDGVYFYSILRNTAVVETRKLIVKN